MRTKSKLKLFNKRFAKIVDDLTKEGFNYPQIWDIMNTTFVDKREKRIIDLHIHEFSQDEISKKTGYSKSLVSLTITNYHHKIYSKRE